MTPDAALQQPTGAESPRSPKHARIRRELAQLRMGGQRAAHLEGGSREVVLYTNVPAQHNCADLPVTTDAIVPVPDPYPGGVIDLVGLPLGSPLLPRLKGGTNNQGLVTTDDGRQWQLASYHPHTNGGGPPFDPSRHGFHTYFGEVVAWLSLPV